MSGLGLRVSGLGSGMRVLGFRVTGCSTGNVGLHKAARHLQVSVPDLQDEGCTRILRHRCENLLQAFKRQSCGQCLNHYISSYHQKPAATWFPPEAQDAANTPPKLGVRSWLGSWCVPKARSPNGTSSSMFWAPPSPHHPRGTPSPLTRLQVFKALP